MEAKLADFAKMNRTLAFKNGQLQMEIDRAESEKAENDFILDNYTRNVDVLKDSEMTKLKKANKALTDTSAQQQSKFSMINFIEHAFILYVFFQ